MFKKLLNIYVLLGVVLFLAVAGGLFYFTQIANASVGNLQIYKGAAQLLRDQKASEGKSGAEVRIKDIVKSASESIAGVILKDSTVIRFAQDSEVEIGNLQYENGQIKDAVIKIKFGRLWSRAAPIAKSGQFEVETPTITAAVRGTVFSIRHTQELSALYVAQGEVKLSLTNDRSKLRTLTANQVLKLRNDHLEEDFTKDPTPPDANFFDEWVRFNQEDDNKTCHQNPSLASCRIFKPHQISYPQSSPTLTPTPTTNQISPKPNLTLTSTPAQSPTPTRQPTPTLTPTSTLTPKRISSLLFEMKYLTVKLGQVVPVSVTAIYYDENREDVTSKVTFYQQVGICSMENSSCKVVKKGSDRIYATYQDIKSNILSITAQ